MKRALEKIYPIALLIAFLVGQIVLLFCAWSNLDSLKESVIGFAVGCLLAPALHELGHLIPYIFLDISEHPSVFVTDG